MWLVACFAVEVVWAASAAAVILEASAVEVVLAASAVERVLEVSAVEVALAASAAVGLSNVSCNQASVDSHLPTAPCCHSKSDACFHTGHVCPVELHVDIQSKQQQNGKNNGFTKVHGSLDQTKQCTRCKAATK